MSSPAGAATASLELTSLVKTFGSRRAVDGVTLSLSSGVTGLLGVNGAGKSTLLSMASGILAPDDGTVAVGGHDPFVARTRSAALGGLGLVPQACTFPARFTCTEVLLYLAALREIPRDRRREAARSALHRVDLGDVADAKTKTLSGGMLRRLTIAQALLGEPAVLVLDEPTTGLDPHQRAGVRDLVTSLAADHAVLLASHIVEDIEYTASRIVVLDEGRVRYDGDAAALRDRSPVGGGGSAMERGFLAVVGVGAA